MRRLRQLGVGLASHAVENCSLPDMTHEGTKAAWCGTGYVMPWKTAAAQRSQSRTSQEQLGWSCLWDDARLENKLVDYVKQTLNRRVL